MAARAARVEEAQIDKAAQRAVTESRGGATEGLPSGRIANHSRDGKESNQLFGARVLTG